MHRLFFAFFFVASPHAQAALYGDNVLTVVHEALQTAIASESNQGKRSNAKFFKQTLKRLEHSQFYWDMEVNQGCTNSGDKSVYAHTHLDPRRSSAWINICPVAVKVLNIRQMAHVLIHELAHQQGVRDEAEANYVADRVFLQNSWEDPFLYSDFGAYIEHLSKHSDESKKVIQSWVTADPTMERLKAEMKSKKLWSESSQAWTARPYFELPTKKSAHSNHVFVRFLDFKIKKSRTLTQ